MFVFCSIFAGDHCVVLMGDAYQKGLLPLPLSSGPPLIPGEQGQEQEGGRDLAHRVYEAMRRNALEEPPLAQYLQGKGRRAIHEYLNTGFVPLEATSPLAYHPNGSVSRHVVSQLAS
jgi:hypothetical protein